MRGGPQVDLPTPQGGGLGSSPALSTSGSHMPGSSGASGGYGSGMGYPHPSQPALKRTRSGSKLVPDDGRGGRGSSSHATGLVTHGFSVDEGREGGLLPLPGGPGGVGPGGMGAKPELQRTNTSFFRDLVASDLFSPDSREMFKAWADSPRAGTPNGGASGLSVAAAVASDANAPVSLSRVVSNDGAEPPKITRSLTSYLKEISEPSYSAAAAAAASEASLARQPSLGLGGLSRQPSLSRLPSALVGRQSSEVRNLLGGQSLDSFTAGFIDESNELSSAPPPNALPPALQLSASMDPGTLSDAALGFDPSGGAPSLGLGSLSALGGPPSLALGGPPPLQRRARHQAVERRGVLPGEDQPAPADRPGKLFPVARRAREAVGAEDVRLLRPVLDDLLGHRTPVLPKRPACSRKSDTQNRFTVENAKAA